MPRRPVQPADAINTAWAWVALGSNIAPRAGNLLAMRRELTTDGVTIDRESDEIRTAALTMPGQAAQPDFINQVLLLASASPWPAHQWLTHCQNVERKAGRQPTFRWGPRTADVDILLLGKPGDVVVESPDLVVPHAELVNRPFLCYLLAAVDAQLQHPDGWLFRDRAGSYQPLPSPAESQAISEW
jgi:2-amino-4-hydroxy-6-hydroxymethyldihydropteridine diphosphokinase